MKALAYAAIAVLSVLGPPGCGHGDMMNGGQSSMHEALTDADAENNRHSNACEQADSMPAVLGELDRYEINMAPIMNRMDDALRSMDHCSGGNFGELSRSVTQSRLEMSDHYQRMRSAETLDAARSECSAYAGSMADMMRNMMGDLGGMSCMGAYP